MSLKKIHPTGNHPPQDLQVASYVTMMQLKLTFRNTRKSQTSVSGGVVHTYLSSISFIIVSKGAVNPIYSTNSEAGLLNELINAFLIA